MNDFTVLIATHNRRQLLPRAIGSALKQDTGGETTEILVVDDASTDGTADYVRQTYPTGTVRLRHVEHQGGPGPARDLGLQIARGRWVVILDDDDELLPGALRTIARRLGEFPEPGRFPAFLFRYNGRGSASAPFQLLATDDFLDGTVSGDYVTVWNREVALAAGCRHPESRLGAEGLMWLEIAERYGIPSWGDSVGIVHADAPRRLTDVEAQLQHAAEHAAIQDRYVKLLERRPGPLARAMIARRLFAGGLYSLLAGHRRRGLARAYALLRRQPAKAVLLLLACATPRPVLARLFRWYRS